MRNFFTFGSIKSSDYGLYISGDSVFDSPERDVTTVHVSGKNGDVIIDNGSFKNVKVTYPAFIHSNFQENAQRFRAAFLQNSGYQKLEDTYDFAHYRMARPAGNIEFSMRELMLSGETKITFDCKPQRFLLSGDFPLPAINGNPITNPTLFQAKPMLTVTGTGTITINGKEIVINRNPDTITIDCDQMEAYHGRENRNADISVPNGFPVLDPGDNDISFTVNNLIIRTRWWEV